MQNIRRFEWSALLEQNSRRGARGDADLERRFFGQSESEEDGLGRSRRARGEPGRRLRGNGSDFLSTIAGRKCGPGTGREVYIVKPDTFWALFAKS